MRKTRHAFGKDGYADFYIGGNYKKLTINVTPRTDNGTWNFSEDCIVNLTVLNAETDEVLYSHKITYDSKLITVKADVTDVDYVRIRCERKNEYGFAQILLKDAILTK